ncbi:hypothetical protein RhiirA5_506839 [Rhizophagus irregularis]|uniref:Uncharacterized protein n=1 Tax=Rhizophagus irregularis TaxID=588596 RepID=A0A2N0NQG9_9GLOM|nr:hypothetical protein RhiirA5_506839 [Rhizophagus irregularis]
MSIDPIDRSIWSISGGKELILKFFKQYQLTKGTYLMTWKQYRSLALLPVQGRTARWYRDVAHLCTSRTDNLTPLANSDAWLIGKVNKIHHHEQGISVSYRLGYNDNGTIRWQDTGRVIPAHCYRSPTSTPSPIISLPLVQNIWIHRWIDDDDLKSKLMDIRNILEKRTSVEYYTDGSLRTSIPTSRDKKDSNLDASFNTKLDFKEDAGFNTKPDFKVSGGLPGSEEWKRTKIRSGWLPSSEERKEPSFVRPFGFGVSGGASEFRRTKKKPRFVSLRVLKNGKELRFVRVGFRSLEKVEPRFVNKIRWISEFRSTEKNQDS